MAGEPVTNAAPPRPARARRRPLVLLLACVAFLLVVLVTYAPLSRVASRTRGEHLTVEQARALTAVDLPAGATDVRVYQHTRPDKLVFVDFAIDEAGFLAWAGKHGGKVERIVGTVTVSPRLGFGDRATAVRITDGYAFRNNPAPGMPNAVVVNYDRERGRAYYANWSDPRPGEG